MAEDRDAPGAFTVQQWCGLLRWKLATEAIPLLLGEPPNPKDSSFHLSHDAMPPRHSPWWARRPDAQSMLAWMERNVQDGLLPVAIDSGPDPINRGQYTVKARYVDPRWVLRWWVAQGYSLPDALRAEAERRGWFADDHGAAAPQPVADAPSTLPRIEAATEREAAYRALYASLRAAGTWEVQDVADALTRESLVRTTDTAERYAREWSRHLERDDEFPGTPRALMDRRSDNS